MSEVIEISDDSDFELPFIGRRPYNNEDDDDVVVLEDPRPSSVPPPSSLPSSSQEQLRNMSDLEDMEIPNPSEFIYGVSGSSYRDRTDGLLSSLDFLNQNILLQGASDEPSQPKSTRRRRKTAEDKALEQAVKELEKARKKQETQRRRAEAAARKAEEKASHKASKAVNKRVIDKKTTLKDMIIELSPRLFNDLPLKALLKQKMAEFNCTIQPISSSGNIDEQVNVKALMKLDINIIRWKRHVRATYDESQRKWIPLPEDQHYLRPEGTYLIYVTGDELVNSLSTQPTVPSLERQVSMLRQVLGPKYHIHLMLCGWKGKTNLVQILDHVQSRLVALQVKESLYVEEVDDIENAVTWIYNISADLGIKPHKLIERSHLPFCSQTSGASKTGKTSTDTFEKMLAQLPRLSENSARAIVGEFGSINELMEAYRKAETVGMGPMMLANVAVPGSRILNKALSERLYHLLWGSDPKLLVN